MRIIPVTDRGRARISSRKARIVSPGPASTFHSPMGFACADLVLDPPLRQVEAEVQ
jgi:hypothetical protein